MTSPYVQRVLDRLKNVRPAGEKRWMALCPAHNDHHPSLSVMECADGRCRPRCYAECEVEDIVHAIGLTMRDLAPPPPTTNDAPHASYASQPHHRTAQPATSSRRPKAAYPSLELAIAAVEGQTKGECVARYLYTDSFAVTRFENADGKLYRPFHHADTGWMCGDPSGPLPLYGVQHLRANEPIIIVEGEKCANVVRSLDLIGVTSAHGAKSAHKSDWSPLAGRECWLIPDNDDAGERYMHDVATILTQLQPPATCRIIRLPGLAEHGDIADFVAPNGPGETMEDDAIRALIQSLAAEAKPFDPTSQNNCTNKSAASATCDDATSATSHPQPSSTAPSSNAASIVDSPREPIIIRLADVEPTEVRWFWPGRIPLGCLTLLVGHPGCGKSFVTMDLGAHATTGRPWPASSIGPIAGNVILISAEDDPATVIRPRLDACGADTSRVFFMNCVKGCDKAGKPCELAFTLSDVDMLERMVQRLGNVRLVVIDPIGGYLGAKTDAHRENEVRSILTPLANLAHRENFALVAVCHTRKGAVSRADDAVLGSRGFSGLARSVLHLMEDRDDSTHRLLLPGKNNYAAKATGLRFEITGDAPYVRWLGEAAMTADDYVEASGSASDDRSAIDETCEWLMTELATGDVPAKEAYAKAKQDGITSRTLRRAKEKMNVHSRRRSEGDWAWRLPSGATHSPDQEGQPP